MNRFLSLLIGGLWCLAVIQILYPSPLVPWAMTGMLACLVLVVLPTLARHSLILCVVLALATCGLAAAYGQWHAIPDGIARAAIFPAFLSTIVLLRAAADQRPEITAARDMFGALDRSERDSGIVIGTHLIGSILQVGVFAILSPILGRDASDDERRQVFTVAIRGMGSVPFWSPFVVGMGVASQYLPLVPLWQVMSLGLALSVLAIIISFLGFDRTHGLAHLWRALRSFGPVALPIFIAAFIVVLTTTLTGLSTLQALVVSLPIPCLLAVLQVRSGSVRRTLRRTFDGIGRIGPESTILACATTLGMVFEAALPQTGILDWLGGLALPAAAVIFIVIMTMNLAGLCGVHAIVTGTFLLVMFTSVPTGVSDLVLMQALLVGWGLCSGISIGSLSIATGAAMFRLPPTELVTRANIAYVFLTSAIVGILLTAMDALLI